MTPLPLLRAAVLTLAAAALLPLPSRAQSEQEARDAMAALKAKYAHDGAQAAAAPAGAPASASPAAAAPALDPAKVRESQQIVENAGIPTYKLIDQSDDGPKWTTRNVTDLGPAITAASRAVTRLYEQNPSNVSATFYGNGTMVNLEESIKYATGAWGGSDMKRGCVSHQQTTLSAVQPVLKDSSLEVHGVFVVRKVTGHHAVIVFPKGTDWKKTGVVLDAWIHQSSEPKDMTYLFKDWYGVTSWKVELE